MKYSYKHIFLAFVLMFFIGGSMAQTSKEKIDALKVAFINKNVNFTNQEALAFWPLYNEMNDKLDANRKVFKARYPATASYNFATDKEAEEYLNAELALRQKEYELYKEYYNDKFKKILPVKKVVLLRRAEEDFKKELVKFVKEN